MSITNADTPQAKVKSKEVAGCLGCGGSLVLWIVLLANASWTHAWVTFGIGILFVVYFVKYIGPVWDKEGKDRAAAHSSRVQASIAELSATKSFGVGRYESGLIQSGQAQTSSIAAKPPKAGKLPPDTTCFVTASELVFVDGLPSGFIENGRVPRNSVRKLTLKQGAWSHRLHFQWEDSRGVEHEASFVFHHDPDVRDAVATSALSNIDRCLVRRIAADVTSVAVELKKLAELAQEGVLNQQEWERAKELYLGKPRDKRDDALQNLRRLYELQKAGVLSPMEFNMKKWDILSRRG